jgi:tetratricopeptide (TPR) repeat protein
LNLYRQAKLRDPAAFLLAHFLGMAYHGQSRYDLAERYYLEALRGREDVLPPDHPDTMQTRGNLGWVYLLTARYSEAGPLFARALEAARKLDSDPAGMVPYFLASVGLNHLLQGQFAEAEKSLSECVAIRREKEADRWTYFDAQALLGRALLGLKRPADAEPLLRAGFEGMKAHAAQIAREAHGRTPLADTTAALVEATAALGRPVEEVERWRAELARLRPAADRGPAPREQK